LFFGVAEVRKNLKSKVYVAIITGVEGVWDDRFLTGKGAG
jgi:hypothetical protein